MQVGARNDNQSPFIPNPNHQPPQGHHWTVKLLAGERRPILVGHYWEGPSQATAKKTVPQVLGGKGAK